MKYDQALDPPAPLVWATFVNPENPRLRLRLRPLLDSGSDISAIPDEKIVALGLERYDAIRLTGINNVARSAPTYLANVQLADWVFN
jgi:hypothetical protein